MLPESHAAHAPVLCRLASQLHVLKLFGFTSLVGPYWHPLWL